MIGAMIHGTVSRHVDEIQPCYYEWPISVTGTFSEWQYLDVSSLQIPHGFGL